MAISQWIESGLSIEDHRYIEEHGLGDVVGVYRIKRGVIRFWRGMSIFFIILGPIVLGLGFLRYLRDLKDIFYITAFAMSSLLIIFQVAVPYMTYLHMKR